MKSIEKRRAETLFSKIEGKKIAVIGDIMLDRYLWGKVSRISPEAPVPVVQIEQESERLGGAANVANNISSLGGIPILFGTIGDDIDGENIRNLMKKRKYFTDGLVMDKSRPTTVKTRVIAHNQHVVRTDKESVENIDTGVAEKLKKSMKTHIKNLDALIIEDYNKGLLSKEIIGFIIELALKENLIITVDPKINNFFEYKNVTVFKPNLKETQESLGFKINNNERLEIAGKMLLDRLNSKYVLITRGDKGMSLFGNGKRIKDVETKALKVHDVSGAGDTVISTLTLFLAGGADILEATTLANYAAGIVCGEVGIVPIDKDKLKIAVVNQKVE